MNYSLQDNQNGTYILAAVDNTGAPAVLPADVTLVSSDPTIATAVFKAGNSAGTYLITAVKPGNVSIVAASASLNISTTFAFVITGGPAASFTLTLQSVASN